MEKIQVLTNKTRDVPSVGLPSASQRDQLKASKIRLGIIDGLKFSEARRGDERVLSFGPRPDFICEWLVLENADPQDCDDALLWILNVGHDWRAHSMSEWLELAMGRAGVAEVS